MSADAAVPGPPPGTCGSTPIPRSPTLTSLARDRLRDAFRHAPTAQAVVCADGRITDVNVALCDLVGRHADQLLGMSLADLVEPGARGALVAHLAQMAAGGPPPAPLEMRIRRGALRPLDACLLLSALPDGAGGTSGFAAAVVDLAERREAEDRLVHRATHDCLTGLPNRELFLARLDDALRRVGRRPGAVALLFVDLDRFKIVNDSLGHAAGDQVLVEAGRRLREVVREGDTVARHGGDEFTILCEDVSGDRIPILLAQRVLRRLAEPVAVEGRELMLSGSVGIALARDPRDRVDDLLRDADLALYRAKDRGRNRYELFHASMRAPALARLDEAEALRRALERDELRVHFQPDVRLVDGSVAGVEALIRWQHPTRGLIGPDAVIPLAEQTGLIVPIGEWVLQEACREVMSWPAPPFRRPLPVSVNLSARQLATPGLVVTIHRALAAADLPPERLVLEITESMLMEDASRAVETLDELRAIGVRVAIDDFGTGYSSLSYLRRFPVDLVKIDRSFVAGLGRDPAAEAIVGAVVNLSHALGLEVVGEGVEEERQVVALRGLRCDRGQGFHWSPPLPAAEARRLQTGPAPEEMRPSLVDLRPVLACLAGELRAATARPVLLEVPANLGPVVADAAAVRSVLDGLLANAVAYSPEGRPVLISATTDRRRLRVSVSDFGIGMSVAEAARCFEQFWQAEPRSRGTGMGLFIVRSLVEAMGGEIGVRSSRGKGTTFTFTLPRTGRPGGRLEPVAAAGVGERSMVREFKRQLGISGG